VPVLAGRYFSNGCGSWELPFRPVKVISERLEKEAVARPSEYELV
jgi:hypothetical protein